MSKEKERQPKDLGQIKDAELLGKLETQVKEEIEFARRHKEGKIKSWHMNESMYFQELREVEDDRANLGIENTKMLGFVETLLSKIDNPPRIRYAKAAEEDLTRAKNLNALIERESSPIVGAWGYKDLLGKKQGILYGRVANRAYGTKDKDGFKFIYEPIDIYEFLIDPAAGGVSHENAMYLGYTGIWKSKEDLKEGVLSRGYDKEAVEALITSGSDGHAGDEEEHNQENRYAALVKNSRTFDRKNQYKLWEWYTTYDSVRYYVLFSERGEKLIKATKLTNMFKSNLYPVTTWAVYPDLAEFWTVAPATVMRPIFIAQGTSINQMIDNSNRINYPHRIVRAGTVRNTSSLRWKKNRVTTVSKKVSNLKDAVQTLDVPSLNNPAKVYDILEGIGNTEGGVNAGARGAADEEKVGIYEGNIQQMADRFGVINKSYSQAYAHLGKLFYHAVNEHMDQETAIDILGIEGVEHKKVKKEDLISNSRMFGITVESSDAEAANSNIDKKNKIGYLEKLKGDKGINQQVRQRMEGEIIGFDPEDIKQLQNVENTANAKLMSEAAQAISDIIQGMTAEEVGINDQADTAFLRKIVDYMSDHRADLKPEVYGELAQYYENHRDVVIENSVDKAEQEAANQGNLQQMLQGGGLPPE